MARIDLICRGRRAGRGALWLGVAAWLAAGHMGCRAPVPPGLQEIPHPDVSSMEPAARRQIATQREHLDDALKKPGEADKLASAFGRLGELYHAYELRDAALAAYSNASHLDPESFLWPYYRGLLHLSAGELAAAQASLSRALERRPTSLTTRLRLGEALLGLGRHRDAEPLFRQVLEDESLAAAAQFGLGRVHVAAGDDTAAAAALEAALEGAPDATAVRHALGLAYRRLGRPEAAEALLQPSPGVEVTFPDPLAERLETLAVSSGALFRRGNRALTSGRLEEAVEAFRGAIEARPDYGEGRRNLALALLRLDRPDEAVQTLEAGIDKDPEHVWMHFDLGNAELVRGRGEAAARAFRRAAQLAPDFVAAHFNLANALAALERWEEALPALERALELDPSDHRARYLGAMARHRSGESAAAEEELRILLAERPADLTVRQGLAAVLDESARHPQALRVLQGGLAEDPPPTERAHLLTLLGQTAWKIGRRPEALRYFRLATEVTPDSADAWVQWANALQLSGQLEEAADRFGRATALDPGQAEAWISEASIWILRGRFAHAKTRLENALRALPDHPRLSGLLARLLATSPDPAVRDGRRALALARQAHGLEASVDHAENVGMALAELGQFDQATRWQASLVQSAMQRGDRALAQRLARHLALYQQRQPVRFQAP